MANLAAHPPVDLEKGESLLAETGRNAQRRLLHASVGARRSIHTQPQIVRQPSILDLLTALPLLLSLDHDDYTATLNSVQDLLTLTDAAPQAWRIKARRSNSDEPAGGNCGEVHHDAYGDAATTAVRAVLRTSGGSPSWQVKRRRLRRVALDAFFRPSLPAQISARAGAAEASTSDTSDGVRRATARLLAHTYEVMADLSPTQAHLVKLFARQILCQADDKCEAAAPAGDSSSMDKPEQRGEASCDDTQKDGQALDASLSQGSLRSIMKAWTLPAAGTVTGASSGLTGQLERSSSLPSSPSSSTIAEQLLYIILRTSIAANTPLRVDKGDGASGAKREGFTMPGDWTKRSALHAPLSSVDVTADALLTPSSKSTPSSTCSAARKKLRTDAFGSLGAEAVAEADETEPARAVEGPTALFLKREGQSIRYHSTSVARGQDKAAVGTVLPYEPRCWLGPSTVALVERSMTLRRQQRWTCDRDPVIEATIAGEGMDLRDYNYAGTSGDAALYDRRGHWAPLADIAWDRKDAVALASFVRDNGLPFTASTASAAKTAGAAAVCASPSPVGTRGLRGTAAHSLYAMHEQEARQFGQPRIGVLHWTLEEGDASAEGGETGLAVRSLFMEKIGRSESQTDVQGGPLAAAANAAAAELESEAQRRHTRSEPSTMPLALPACRTPFVSCSTLYNPIIYARVYVALHRCTAGLVDPYELTYYDMKAGPNLVEIRVHPELYATQQQVDGPQRQSQSTMVHSGFTSMLEWGCRCGTLLLRLHRLCEAADGTQLRASLGSYGRCAMDTLRLFLCFLQRQIWELGDRLGGAHRLSLTELLTAQQRLQNVVEQVEALAVFFMVPSTPAAATTGAAAISTGNVAAGSCARSKVKPAVAWDPVAVLQQNCCSALLLSRLHQFFTARHANALGQHDSVAGCYTDLQQESLEEWMSALRESGARSSLRDGKADALADFTADGQRQRKDLLSHSIDAIGLLLRATLRPFHAMLHRWLTAGELTDPYDEFFIVPSHGQTYSGFMLDLSPQRLPVFVSAAAAKDLLHSGVSLRVLRAAATHVVLSAQKDMRRLQGLSEMTDAAVEDYAEELQDTQTLQCAIQKFIERLVRGAPTEDGLNAMGLFGRGLQGRRGAHGGESKTALWRAADGAEGELEQALPLPPRVDVLSAYGAINWWRQHYQSCTQVLLEVMEEAAGVETSQPKNVDAKMKEGRQAEGAVPALAAAGSASRADSGQDEKLPVPQLEGAATASADPSPSSGPSRVSLAPSNAPAVLSENAEKDDTQRHASDFLSTVNTTTAVSPHSREGLGRLVYPLGLVPATSVAQHHCDTLAGANAPASEEEEQPYITVFMNSDDEDEDDAIASLRRKEAAGRGGVAADLQSSLSVRSSPSFSSNASAATTSVLGLRRIASSKLSIGTTISSTASSRGTIALYGAITEELRQVSLLEQQTEARAGQSRNALRAEFNAQMWRRKRDMRLNDWKAQRLALRLRRVRAMEGIVEELREAYGIHGFVLADESSTRGPHKDNDAEQREQKRGGTSLPSPPLATAPRFVIPLRHFPPPSASPPALLYAEETQGEGERHGGVRRSSQGQQRPRRTSFAATTTVVELPSEVALPALERHHRQLSAYAAASPRSLGGILLPPRPTRTLSANGPDFLTSTLPTFPQVRGDQGQEVAVQYPLPLGTRTTLPRERMAGNRRSRSSPEVGLHAYAGPPHPRLAQRGSPEKATTLTSNSVSFGNSGVMHQSRELDTAVLKTDGLHHERTAPDSRSNSSHPRPSGITADALARYRNEEHMGTETLREQWYRTAALPSSASVNGEEQGNGSGTVCVRYDELGYAHPDSSYIVADINDDEFLFMRTGPKSYARRESEGAALARLASERAALDRCTVDEPGFLQQLQQAARAAARFTADVREVANESAERVGGGTFGEECGHSVSAATCGEKDGVSDTRSIALHGDDAEEDAQTTQSLATFLQADIMPSDLPEGWRDGDPLDCLRQPALSGADANDEGDSTDRLWSWTPAEAHRWYFDSRMPLHHVLTRAEVDRALLVDLPLTCDEAEALQCCGGYYRALGQYTSSFLTHKALQLTLLPPYGSLYRLTTQFLDVCLLQNSAVAARIVDAWIASVDAALEMMAEQEEAAMVRAVLVGATSISAPLASLTDRQQGLDMHAALASLNAVFQREWDACVHNGESTVKLEWALTTEREKRGCSGAGKRSVQCLPHLGSTQKNVGEAEDEEAGVDLSYHDDDDDDALDEAAPPLGWHHHDHHLDPAHEGGAEEDDAQRMRKDGATAKPAAGRSKAGGSRRLSKRPRASPIQSFLATLQLSVASRWCSGAWLLPDRTTHCLGGVCRTLLFWKSVERVVLHTWQAGMNSGLSSVFFFCTTVQQVLLSTLQERLWGRLTELTATYRESLQFEAGVLYTYRALDSFTEDHERFLQDCEFYTLCGPPFQSRVQPLLSAMMREVEVAERALRFAQVSIRVARRQYMATFHSMVSHSDESSSSGDDDRRVRESADGKSKRRKHSSAGVSSSAPKRKRKLVTKIAEAGVRKQPIFTPSRWCRRRTGSATTKGCMAAEQSLLSYQRSVEDTLAQHRGGSDGPSYLHNDNAKDRSRDTPISQEQEMKQRSKSCSTSVAAKSVRSGGSETRAYPLGDRSNSALSSSTATYTTTTFSATASRTPDGGGDDEGTVDDRQHYESSREDEADEERHTTKEGTAIPADTTTARRKAKRRCQSAKTTTKAAPRRSIMESATMNTTPIYIAVLAAQQQQRAQGTASTTGAKKRSRSAALSTLHTPAVPLPSAPHQVASQASSLAAVASPSTKRRPKQHHQDRGHRRRGRGAPGPRLTAAERQERRDKLRVIAERKINEETEHQRRLMRDTIARRLRSFASLTQALRGALSDIITADDLAAQETLYTAEGNPRSICKTAAASDSTAATKELHNAQLQQMSRYTYLSSIVRRLDSLIDVMASQL
ncbi:hypothetical protein ABL78_2321 [Leptomonas seymouri]|uniref:Gamma tubulin complex component protein N-terminal domain-containing protein n=1 Tax=Leptomonas seymouri TaxID=5684 RepID=A0A0N1I7Q6_LEPSE|nr:hypothetical protein ABL78_2321 [Leptomonas seymouri]|eukprot:KPI88588.1 hypothetical protein ABL78_2321 [Leptomonas seymouri]